MNAIVETKPQSVTAPSGRMAASEVIQHAMVVQEVMRAVMKPGTHYGEIPGTDKPTLLQPGADKLCMTFRISPQFEVDDLSVPGTIRYRVKCRGVHQTSGVDLGSGIGEGSTDEEKYRWRRAVCDEEFDNTPENMRRLKYGRKGGGFYTTKQVRTEPADVANTVLKMAAKRAKIAMVLNVTAASDMFGQDLEDLDEALRESLSGHDAGADLDALRGECSAKVAEADTPEKLRAVSKECVPLFQKAGDREGYAKFAEAVQRRGAELKAKEPASAPAPAASPAPAPVESQAAGSDDEFVQQMNAAEQSGAAS